MLDLVVELFRLLPGFLHIIEEALGAGNGAAKQEAVINAISESLAEAGMSPGTIRVVVALLKLVIPRLIARYNADPKNTAFVKSTPASS